MSHPTVSIHEVDKLLKWRFKLWQATYGNKPTPQDLVDSLNKIQAMDEPFERYWQFRKFFQLRQDQRIAHARKVIS